MTSPNLSLTASPPQTQALSEGTLGMALLPIERGDLKHARRLLREAIDGGVSTGANASLFHGAPALEFVLGRAGRTEPRIHEAVDRLVAIRLASATRRRGSRCQPSLAEFDLIRGLTGLGALLLTRPTRSPLLTEVLAYLVSLAHPVTLSEPADGAELPGWWTLESPGHDDAVPGGHSNHGVAHGIAGPLALLALAARHGIRPPGSDEAIRVFADWLRRFGGHYWMTRDQLAEQGYAPGSVPARPSWCYGALGIARSLQLAAHATGDQLACRAAEDIALSALADPASTSLVTDASLCHGWAGLLTATRALAVDATDPGRFSFHLEHLKDRLADELDTVDKPGFLEGRTGALLAADGPDRTGWTRALLIT
ncbi:lanthionine synthetase C family protein [Saccharopolyspora endophytica]|uniref:Lanthionine synthetase C family protein n=1 Tax=Saccharopolyspora endophytica TaxID=543886 RepID=A0ABS5DK11_9PSEU|nr:lanthionine synthetase C family protein [Saccharopolyspora endophytica]MBQ0926635.1 lanthionine synthetase C family protein [Saccharopolyspora endophytica]